MRIPKSIEVRGVTIQIQYRKIIKHPKGFLCDGLWVPEESKILLRLSSKTSPISNQDRELTFLHELQHAVLSVLGYEELCQNEELIEKLSECNQQIFKQL